MGCDAKIVEEGGSTDVIIAPGKLHGAEIETYDDHRVAMSFAVAGLAVDGIVIKNPMCCRKTFLKTTLMFWKQLKRKTNRF